MTPDGWRPAKFGDVASLEYGKSLPAFHRKGGTVAVCGSNGIIGYHAEPLVDGPGIVVGRKGSVGVVTWIDSHFWPIDTTYYVSALEDADTRWLYYAVSHLRLERLNEATGIPGLNRNTAAALKFDLPPLPEQHKIAAILSSVDDAIEKTRAVIDQVQVVKRGLMQELLTRGLPGRHAQFKQTVIGRMPEGWKSVPGIDLFRLSGGYGPDALTFDDDGECLFVKVDALNNVANRKEIRYSTARFSQIDNPNIKTYGLGSLVFPKRGAAIFKNRVRLLRAKTAVDPNLMVITPTAEIDPRFFMYLLLQIGLFNLSDNSGIPQLNNKHLYPRLFPVPSIDEQRGIAKTIGACDDRIMTEEDEVTGLLLLKRAVMSVLLTGELRVTPDPDVA